jgi:hypothetical protein
LPVTDSNAIALSGTERISIEAKARHVVEKTVFIVAP